MREIFEIIRFSKEQNLNFNKNLFFTVLSSVIEVITLSTFIPLILKYDVLLTNPSGLKEYYLEGNINVSEGYTA